MIELKNVVKKFDGISVLDHVDMKIDKGITFGLLGSNGAGKSTIFRLIQGIYRSEEGEVLIEGEKAFDHIVAKEKIFFVNDETVQYSSYTVKELKEFYRGFYPNFSEEVFEKLMEVIKLPLNKKLNRFSKGMKRQAIVIVALACQPEYLMLDEAFDGLDPTMRTIVKRMIVDAMLDRNMTTIISSHNLNEINDMCDEIALLHNGAVILQKDVNSIHGSAYKIQVAFAEEKTQADFSQFNIRHYETSGSVINFIVQGELSQIKETIQQMNPKVFDVVPLTLEEVFIYEMEVHGYDYRAIN